MPYIPLIKPEILLKRWAKYQRNCIYGLGYPTQSSIAAIGIGIAPLNPKNIGAKFRHDDVAEKVNKILFDHYEETSYALRILRLRYCYELTRDQTIQSLEISKRQYYKTINSVMLVLTNYINEGGFDENYRYVEKL